MRKSGPISRKWGGLLLVIGFLVSSILLPPKTDTRHFVRELNLEIARVKLLDMIDTLNEYLYLFCPSSDETRAALLFPTHKKKFGECVAAVQIAAVRWSAKPVVISESEFGIKYMRCGFSSRAFGPIDAKLSAPAAWKSFPKPGKVPPKLRQQPYDHAGAALLCVWSFSPGGA